MASLLIEFSADVMAVDKKGRTPLFCACAEKRMECIQYYCEQAHDHLRLVSLADHRGDTPLHAASCNGHTRVVRMLVGAAANVDAKNVRGLTALELARHNSHPECIAVLEPHTTMSSLPSSQTTSFSSTSTASGSLATTQSMNGYKQGPQTPKGQQVMRMVYEDQASMDFEPHAGWGGMSERGSQSATSTSNKGKGAMHIVSRSERAGYDANQVDPGLARLMAAVTTPGRNLEEEDNDGNVVDAGLSKLERLVGGGSGSGSSSGETKKVDAVPIDPKMARLMAAVNGTHPLPTENTSPQLNPHVQQQQYHQQQQQQQHWVSCVDPSSGSLYYKELISATTQWEVPEAKLVNQEWKHDSGSGVWTNVRTNEQKMTPG